MAECSVMGCGSRAVFEVFAAYPTEQGNEVHPRLARYPAPMWLACAGCLAGLMVADNGKPNAADYYVRMAS